MGRTARTVPTTAPEMSDGGSLNRLCQLPSYLPPLPETHSLPTCMKADHLVIVLSQEMWQKANRPGAVSHALQAASPLHREHSAATVCLTHPRFCSREPAGQAPVPAVGPVAGGGCRTSHAPTSRVTWEGGVPKPWASAHALCRATGHPRDLGCNPVTFSCFLGGNFRKSHVEFRPA